MRNEDFSMLDTGDNQELFQPLINHLKEIEWDEDIEEILAQYHWMGHDHEKTYYKHYGDRSYFYIYHDGKTEGKLVDWQLWNYSNQI